MDSNIKTWTDQRAEPDPVTAEHTLILVQETNDLYPYFDYIN